MQSLRGGVVKNSPDYSIRNLDNDLEVTFLLHTFPLVLVLHCKDGWAIPSLECSSCIAKMGGPVVFSLVWHSKVDLSEMHE